jgi:membrane glycosyltransferase
MMRLPSAGLVPVLRGLALGGAGVAALAGLLLFLQVAGTDGLQLLDLIRGVLIGVATFWLGWGAALALTGLPRRAKVFVPSSAPIRGRTVILVPVFNEDPASTFARIAAMDADLRAEGLADRTAFAILSDTRDETIARREAFWFLRLLDETGGEGRIFYRRRSQNRGRKAGNIADFIRSSGAAWEYALILDADSLMSGATIGEMIRRIEAEPTLGLLQSPPGIIRARSRFGRAMQFAGALHGPVFTRGLARMQGRTGPFWGHNAIVRIRAFAESCGLPELTGAPPFGGHVMSHDYVEAALLARAGWTVRVDCDLTGSWEEGPDNMVQYARRDRRWCQGNLQHARIIGAPGLAGWSRFVFLQGILSYVAPVLWLFFLMASIVAPAFAPEIDYFPQAEWPFPALPVSEAAKAAALGGLVLGLLVLPKLMVAVVAALSGRARDFGGRMQALVATVAELVLSSVMAPVLLMFQARSILQVLMGRDGGWPAQARGDGRMTLGEAWDATHWITLTGLVVLVLSRLLAPDLVLWLLPVTLPMIAAPVIIWWTSRPSRSRLFLTPQEMSPAPVIRRHDAILARWMGLADDAVDPAPVELRHA